jgi:hypothetical protein
MTIERDRRIAIDMVIGAIGVLAALTVAGILYAHFNGGIAVGSRMTLDCQSFATGGYPAYAHKGWRLTSATEVATCEQCPYQCDALANGWSVLQNTYWVTLIYCPPGSRILASNHDQNGNTYVQRCTN